MRQLWTGCKASPPQFLMVFIFFSLSVPLLFFQCATLFAAYPPVVTESNLRQAIMEQGASFSSEELISMDLNSDGVLSVADLIVYVQDNNLPQAVSFVTLESTSNEGDNTLLIGVEYTKEYTGNLQYVIEGTAASGEDFTPLTGILPVDSRLEQIPITFLDDTALENVETILITLIPDTGYNIGASQQHIVYLYDNDSIWRGNLQVDNMLLGFDLTLLKSSAAYQAIVQSDGNNGLPAGDWTTNGTISDDSFVLTIGPMTVNSEDTLLATELQRTLTLTAQTTTTGHIVDLNSIIHGDLLEEFDSVQPQFSRLGNSAIVGSFTLAKDPATIPTAPSWLEP